MPINKPLHQKGFFIRHRTNSDNFVSPLSEFLKNDTNGKKCIVEARPCLPLRYENLMVREN